MPRTVWIDHCHYSSGLIWDAMLKMTGIESGLISDIIVHLVIEKGMRGGISYNAKRYSKANNKYMKCYDDSKQSKFIVYIDANNLYGWEMSQYLGHSVLKWLNQKETDKFDVNSIGENISIGYILEADFKYPGELDKLHNGYLLAPEEIKISDKML